MLSDRENIHRMRCKLIENDYFNTHEESSRLRDNLRIERTVLIDENTSKEPLKIEYKDNSIDDNEHLDISNDTQLFLSEEKEKM